MSLADVHARATRFQSRIRFRNWTEYAASVLVIGYFGWATITAPTPIIQLGAALIVLGALYVCWKLYSLGRAATKAEMDQAANLTDFHRAELLRQREALSTVWRWYLAPFIPGMVVFLLGVSLSIPELPLAIRVAFAVVGLAIVGVVFSFVGWINALAVKRLDKELAALDRAT